MTQENEVTPSTTNTAALELLPCVMCGCPDELELDSSSAAEASWIECNACQYRMQEKCDEETLAERWNELDRRDMPAFVTQTETPARDVPAQEASLRRSLDYWHGRAKTAEAKLTQQQGGEQEAGVERLTSRLPAWIDPRTLPSCECWAALGANKNCPHCTNASRAYDAIAAALLAKSDAYDALVALVEAAPWAWVGVDGDGQWIADDDDPPLFAEGRRVRLLLVREGGDGK